MAKELNIKIDFDQKIWNDFLQNLVSQQNYFGDFLQKITHTTEYRGQKIELIMLVKSHQANAEELDIRVDFTLKHKKELPNEILDKWKAFVQQLEGKYSYSKESAGFYFDSYNWYGNTGVFRGNLLFNNNKTPLSKRFYDFLQKIFKIFYKNFLEIEQGDISITIDNPTNKYGCYYWDDNTSCVISDGFMQNAPIPAWLSNNNSIQQELGHNSVFGGDSSNEFRREERDWFCLDDLKEEDSDRIRKEYNEEEKRRQKNEVINPDTNLPEWLSP